MRRSDVLRSFIFTSCLGIAAAACGEVSATPDAGGSGNADGAPTTDGARADASGPDFVIAVDVQRLDARVPEVTPLEVSLDRKNGFSEPVVVEVTDLPSGVSANSITIPADGASGTLEIDASNGTPGILTDITIIGTAGSLTRTAGTQLFLVGSHGAVDVDFGTDGALAMPGLIANAQPADILALDGGKFLLTGTVDSKLFAARFLEDGTLDTAFGDNGVTTLDASGAGVSNANRGRAVRRSDGKIVLLGFGFASGTQDRDVILARLNDDGSLDTSFAGGGLIVHPFGTMNVQAGHLALDANERIVVSGTHVITSGEDRDVFVARFTADGLVDDGFGGEGYVTHDLGDSFGGPLAVHTDGSVVVRGSSCGTFACSYGLVRYTASGMLETNFGDDGHVPMPDGDRADEVRFLADGDLLIAGTDVAATNTPVFYRLEGNGSLDVGFGASGKATVPVPNEASGSLSDMVLGEGASVMALGNAAGVLLTRMADTSTGGFDTDYGSGGSAVTAVDGFRAQQFALNTRYRLTVMGYQSEPLEYFLLRVWY